MITAVLDYFGADVSRVRPGVWQPIKCPFHGDEHESASVLPAGVRGVSVYGGFRCHACDIKGDAVKLLMQQEGLTFNAAVNRAAEIARDFGEDVQPKSLEGSRLPGRTRNFAGPRKR